MCFALRSELVTFLIFLRGWKHQVEWAENTEKMKKSQALRMTRGVPHLRRSDHLRLISQPFPGFPVELGGFGKLHAPFLTERRTRGLFQRSVAGNPGPGWADVWLPALRVSAQWRFCRVISLSSCRRQVAVLLMNNGTSSSPFDRGWAKLQIPRLRSG